MTTVKRFRSSLWNSFTCIDDHYAACNICNAKCSYKTSTSNLKKHLITKHKSISSLVLEQGHTKTVKFESTYIPENENDNFDEANNASAEEFLVRSKDSLEASNEEEDNKNVESRNKLTATKIAPKKFKIVNKGVRLSVPQTKTISSPMRSDEHQIFANYVALELRSLHREENRKKLKRMITKAILEVSELEDMEETIAVVQIQSDCEENNS